MDIQFMPDLFLDCLLNSVNQALMMAVCIFLQHIIFLEHNTPKQNKVTRIIIAAYIVIQAVMSVLFGFFGEIQVLKLINIVSSSLFFVVIIYRSITGRKKAKWLG